MMKKGELGRKRPTRQTNLLNEPAAKSGTENKGQIGTD